MKSKEQTPITAEEWLDEEYPYILDGFEYLEIDKQVLDVMEQYANAKVLEALEMVDKRLNENLQVITIFELKKFIETEVKTKYKL